jgi:hypothetical protein
VWYRATFFSCRRLSHCTNPGWSFFLALHFLVYCIVFARRPEATQI